MRVLLIVILLIPATNYLKSTKIISLLASSFFVPLSLSEGCLKMSPFCLSPEESGCTNKCAAMKNTGMMEIREEITVLQHIAPLPSRAAFFPMLCFSATPSSSKCAE